MKHSKLLLSSALLSLIFTLQPLSSASAAEGYPGLVDFEVSNFPTLAAPTPSQGAGSLGAAANQQAKDEVTKAISQYHALQDQKKALQSQLTQANNPSKIASLQKQIQGVDAKIGDALKATKLNQQKPIVANPAVIEKMAQKAIPVSKKSIGTRSQRDIEAYQARQKKMEPSLKRNAGGLLKMPSLNLPKVPNIKTPNINIKAPSVNLPGLKTPALNLPKLPALETPKLPKVNQPPLSIAMPPLDEQ
jgi:hypothetical protein